MSEPVLPTLLPTFNPKAEPSAPRPRQRPLQPRAPRADPVLARSASRSATGHPSVSNL
ncbi:hypothetical protein NOCARDAX2BIS_460053 [Nocardioides sp. AX2bis]|nr:hypothetical protein NOCARDAX2BIS_460053 [Nocardioides sp. AX2bis]